MVSLVWHCAFSQSFHQCLKCSVVDVESPSEHGKSKHNWGKRGNIWFTSQDKDGGYAVFLLLQSIGMLRTFVSFLLMLRIMRESHAKWAFCFCAWWLILAWIKWVKWSCKIAGAWHFQWKNNGTDFKTARFSLIFLLTIWIMWISRSIFLNPYLSLFLSHKWTRGVLAVECSDKVKCGGWVGGSVVVLTFNNFWTLFL